MRVEMGARIPNSTLSDRLGGHKPVASASRVDAGVPSAAAALGWGGAGNLISGSWAQQAQVRDLRRTRPFDFGFPSVACDAPLLRLAFATGFRPVSPALTKSNVRIGLYFVRSCRVSGRTLRIQRTCERRDARARRETASKGRVQASSRSWPVLYT